MSDDLFGLSAEDEIAIRRFLADQPTGTIPPPPVYGTRRDRQPCLCGHQRVAHRHYTRSERCASCDRCPQYRRDRTRRALAAAATVTAVWTAAIALTIWAATR